MSRDGPEDKSYDAGFEATLRPRAERTKGLVLNKDGTLTVYFDYAHVSKDRVAAWGAPPLSVCANASGIAVPWEITEALGKLVSEGGASGTAWSFSADPAFTEVNLLDPVCLSDLTAKLQQMKDARSVPASVRRWQAAGEAVARYDAAIAWIAAHGNGCISNGPFFVDRVDTGANTIELAANRDPAYPYEAGYWNRQLKARFSRIESVNIPSLPSRGKEAVITARVSMVDYPSGTVRPADTSVRLKLTLVVPSGEKTYRGVFLGAGTFSVTIPAGDMDLKPGGYTVVAESALAGESPSVEPATLVVF
jgi:peptide/nickel transport system substrate-binding protein